MLTIFFIISILNVFTMLTNSKIIKDSQDLTLMIRIFINLFFLIMILIIKTIIIINNINDNNNSSYKLLKNNNVYYSNLVDFNKLLMKTQTNFLSRINLVNKT